MTLLVQRHIRQVVVLMNNMVQLSFWDRPTFNSIFYDQESPRCRILKCEAYVNKIRSKTCALIFFHRNSSNQWVLWRPPRKWIILIKHRSLLIKKRVFPLYERNIWLEIVFVHSLQQKFTKSCSFYRFYWLISVILLEIFHTLFGFLLFEIWFLRWSVMISTSKTIFPTVYL